jgi:phage protein D
MAASSSASQTVPVDVFTGQDFYVPSFEIWKGTRALNEIMQDVMSLSYTDSLTAIDSCELVVNNWDPDRATSAPGGASVSPFKYSDAPTFNPWQPIEVWMGYIRSGADERQKMLTGEIATMTPSFPASGGSTLTVRALNLLHRFRVRQEPTPFLNKKDSEIAEIIIANIAKQIRQSVPDLIIELDADEIAANKTHEEIVPYVALNNQYPINLLLERSRDIGYELFVEEMPSPGAQGKRYVTVHYRPTQVDRLTVYRLTWGVSLISFQPTLQTANQVSSVTVRGWDPSGKVKIEKTVRRADVKGIVHPADLDVDETGLSQREEILVDHPIQSPAEAQVLAEKRMLRLAQGIVEARGKTVGLPNLRAGRKVVIAGLGTRFSGTYLVTSTTHTISESGYTTDFTARMEAKLTGGAS